MILPNLSAGELARIWARFHVYRQGIEIGIMRHVAAHNIESPNQIGQVTHIPSKYYDAQLEWREAANVDLNAPKPFVVLRPEQAQELMDQLWNCGVRPIAAHGSTGQLASTERHLEDMRHLVSHFVKAKLPQMT